MKMNLNQNISGVYRLYFGNIGVLLPLAMLPAVPAAIFTVVNHVLPSTLMTLVGGIIILIAYHVVYGAIVIAVNDLSLGKPISMAEALGRVSPKLAKEIILTGFIQWIMLMLGFILLVIPGIIFSIRYLFSIIVVVQEGAPYWPALERSRDIAKGHGWQIFLHLMAFTIPIVAVFGLIISSFTLFMEFFFNPEQSKFAVLLLVNILQPVMVSLTIIFTLAMYLDLKTAEPPAAPEPPLPLPGDGLPSEPELPNLFPPANE